MSYSQIERKAFEYHDTELLKDIKVNAIRIVKVPHMSSFVPTSDSILNVRTNVGIAGEEYLLVLSNHVDITNIKMRIVVSYLIY